MTTIDVIDQTTHGELAGLDLERIVHAVQVQVQRDFAPIWHTDPGITVQVATEVSPGHWPVFVIGNIADTDAVGWHDYVDGVPVGKVLAGSDLRYGLSVSCTLSHEVLEMILDPDCSGAIQISPSVWAAKEACDPCEQDRWGYQIDGQLVSDFLTPAWFRPSKHGSRAKRTMMRSITHAHTLAPGGYVSLWSQATGWIQQFASKAGAAVAQPEPSSRAVRMDRHLSRACESWEMAQLAVEE